jgi:hypothetical protein
MLLKPWCRDQTAVAGIASRRAPSRSRCLRLAGRHGRPLSNMSRARWVDHDAAGGGGGGDSPVVQNDESVVTVLGGVDLGGEFVPECGMMSWRRRRRRKGWERAGAHAAGKTRRRIRRSSFEPERTRRDMRIGCSACLTLHTIMKQHAMHFFNSIARWRAPAGSEGVFVAHVEEQNVCRRLYRGRGEGLKGVCGCVCNQTRPVRWKRMHLGPCDGREARQDHCTPRVSSSIIVHA